MGSVTLSLRLAEMASAMHRSPAPGPWRVLTHLGGLGSTLLVIALGFAVLALVQGIWLCWHFLRIGAAKRGES